MLQFSVGSLSLYIPRAILWNKLMHLLKANCAYVFFLSSRDRWIVCLRLKGILVNYKKVMFLSYDAKL